MNIASPSAEVDFPPSTAAEQLPRRGNAVTRWGCGLLLRLLGWRIRGAVPAVQRLVVLAGPHTSNWDFVLGMLILGHLGLRMSFLIKESVFRLGFGRLLRWLGAIPVDRSRPKGVLTTVLAGFANSPDGHLLIITPEGTRRGKTDLKEGFYLIAKRADAALLCVTLNYHDRVATMLPAFAIDGRKFAEVAAQVHAAFAGVPGKRGYWMDAPAPATDDAGLSQQ